MHPPQLLYHRPQLLYIGLHPYFLTDALLQARWTIQELLDQLPVHEPVGLFRFSDRVLECAICVKRDVARTLNSGRDGLLEAHQEILFRGSNQGEQVDGAIDLECRS